MTKKPTVLMLPGLGDSGPDHWQSHWERGDPTLRRVIQDDWNSPRLGDWVERLDEVLALAGEPVVLAAHSSGCALVAHWAAGAAPERLALVRGALLVAPSDPEGPNYPTGARGFAHLPLRRLPFPSIVVASDDDPYIEPERARRYAEAWGSRFVLVPGAGHLNTASGHGPWPEGREWLESLRAAAGS